MRAMGGSRQKVRRKLTPPAPLPLTVLVTLGDTVPEVTYGFGSDHEMEVRKQQVEQLTVSMVVGMATPAAGQMSVLQDFQQLARRSLLTGAVGNAVGDGRGGGSTVTARLVGAVADTVGEAGVGAQAGGLSRISSSAAEARGGSQKVVDAGFLLTMSIRKL